MQLMNAALLSENDCAVVISHTGRSREVIELAETIHEHKAKMILVTAYSMSPLARMADAILITPAAEDQHRTEAHATSLMRKTLRRTGIGSGKSWIKQKNVSAETRSFIPDYRFSLISL